MKHLLLTACAAFALSGTAFASDTAKASGEKSHFAGAFLASHFAQSIQDWGRSSDYLNHVLQQDPANADLLKRSMILATGAGDMKTAVDSAKKLTATGDKNGLAFIVLAADAIKNGRPQDATALMDKMEGGDMAAFVKPLVQGWAGVADGKLPKLETVQDTSMHLYHTALMALALGKMGDAQKLTDRLLATKGLSPLDALRGADLLLLLGKTDKAQALLKSLAAQDTGMTAPKTQLEAMAQGGAALEKLKSSIGIKTPAQGYALALMDMARILYQEQSDSSVRIFARLALMLDPTITDAHLLMADSLARNSRFEEAIAELKTIPKDHESYQQAQHYAADLLAQSGDKRGAQDLLEKLFKQDNDIEALIRVGDLRRSDQDFKGALEAYNRAAQRIGDKIPSEFWHLLYARGMAYERQGDWGKAEADLKAALVYQPDNPYLLNYLGYGWADQGKNLDESLKLIARAVELNPEDGYITDSLGWVHYMRGQYHESVEPLEKAVELLPYDPTINDHLGDAYWRVGRKQEARFQWERAISYAEADTKTDPIRVKLANGLDPAQPVREAKHED